MKMSRSLSLVLVAAAAALFVPAASAGLFPSGARGTYPGKIRIVDTKYGVNLTTNSAYQITASTTRFTTGRDPIRFRADGTAKNVNWVSARYTTRRHAVLISGRFRDSSNPGAGPAGTFRYEIRFKAGGVVTVASRSIYNSGGSQTIQFAGRK